MQKLKRVGRILIILYILVAAMLYFLQEKIIFLTSKLPQEYTYSFSEPFEEFFLTADDGAKLNALQFKRENPKGVILYFHGNAGDLSRWGEIATFFAKKEYDVIVMDYRTYGKSTGKLSEAALLRDAQLFYDYTLDNYKEDDIILYGRSLGASVATYTASKNKPAKLVLETPFYNLLEVARKRFPVLPVKWLLKYKFESNKYIGKVTCPVTIFHGTEDAVVPYESGKKLFSLASSNKEFLTVEGGGHNDLILFKAYNSNINQALQIE
ncbi:alpha/beta fold hydrolase [Croceitalea sp. MTPC9]|uniref:alpha/beta hydrolase n=1 Tax=unclassified Croceitalea TaxID=2632280 RepID=UPI002B3E6A6B|nr:alpha/beta fold hydrolase [Croceitalea sp. MTPC6]GMN15767.1 alpha/beta fold hydrolase [Croceitalea sp. MTPC9]